MTARPGRTAQTGDGGGSQTLERGLLVLEVVADAPGATGSEVAVRAGLHRSIVHRLLVSLERSGYVERDAGGRYQVGRTLTTLADRTRPRLHTAAEPVLQDLATELDATASLVEVVAGAAVSTVVAEPPTDGPRFSYRLGNRDPLDRGAGGLAALASGPPAPDEPARVADARSAGVVTTHAELNPGAYGIAAPVPGLRGGRAAVAVITSRPEVAERAEQLVRDAARRIGSAAYG
ncbi:helix-turn-helix domain-containing protein [Mumia sp. zg.B53]|uniref:IclR family transcriptional regulator n=1 Tax=unclassified Mumia TaxID=2621872 RepID=UPI001C6EE595|nr:MULTISPECIES: helix-turn-helix domain-containing protein [unclassified Mumia]MBW9214887.1 helix-turn-helix domain-containing protein [Mumia sp. zg.B53]MDD9350183.1 helix-turn-helix domain-containing protein [Mumia sp.]